MLAVRSIGTSIDRVDGPLKVTGAAQYTYEQPVDKVAYLAVVQSTIAKGHVRAIDAAAARAVPGVVMVVTHENAVRVEVDDDEALRVLQTDAVAYCGQVVAAVVALTPEAAVEAAARLLAE